MNLTSRAPTVTSTDVVRASRRSPCALCAALKTIAEDAYTSEQTASETRNNGWRRTHIEVTVAGGDGGVNWIIGDSKVLGLHPFVWLRG